MRKIKAIICVVLCILSVTAFMTACDDSKPYDKSHIVLDKEQKYQISKTIDELIKTYKYRGVVAVKLNDNIIYFDCVGTDGPDGKDIDGSTSFQVGCLTQNYTAVAALQLADEGKLSLDDNLTKYFDANVADVTVKDILTGKVSFGYYAGEITNKPDMNEKIIELIKQGKEKTVRETITDYILETNVQTMEADKSSMYLLGRVIEQASGMPYKDYVEENIIKKLDLKSTRFVDVKKKYYGYNIADKKWETTQDIKNRDYSYLYSTYGLESSMNDMLTFYEAMFSGKLCKTDISADIAKTKRGKKYGFEFLGGDIDMWTAANLCRAFIHRDNDSELMVLLITNTRVGFDIYALGNSIFNAANSKVTGVILKDAG